jgi:putative peptidoglycan lipid II flippase
MTNRHKAAGVVSLAVMGSRMLGLVRETLFAALFGAGKYLDSFLAAFQIPNLLRDLFAEGALSTAFTTTFAKTLEKEGQATAWRLASLLFTALLLILGGVCVIGIAASPLLVQVTNFGFHNVEGKFELTVQLTRLLFPFILFVSLAAVVMGILNARFIFGLPASASTVFNLVSIVMGVGLAYVFDPQADWRHPEFGARALYGVSLGVLLGGLAQLGMQLPSLWRLGYRYTWSIDFKDPRLRQVWALAWPSMIAGAAVQVNVLVNGMFASEIDGARSWLNCAFRLMQFPIGVFGVAIATVTLPAVARHHARAELSSVGKAVEESLRLAFFLTIPSTVGLMVLAPTIIEVIYQHHKFTAFSTVQTAAALQAYAIGLSGYAGIKVLAPCFYALDRPRTPLNVSVLGIGLNLVSNLILVKVLHWGHVGLAMTTGVLATLNFLQLAYYLRRQVVFGTLRRWGGLLLVLGTAGLACGVAAWTVQTWLIGVLHGFVGHVVMLVASIAAGGLAYLGVAFLLRVDEIHTLAKAVRRRLGR